MTSPQTSHVRTMRAAPWIVAADGAAGVFSILTLSGPVMVLFLRELGLDEARMGVVFSLLPFLGILTLVTGVCLAGVNLKHAAVSFYMARNLVLILLLAAPWVALRWGLGAVFAWVAGVVILFGLMSMVADLAEISWFREILPDHIRGKLIAKCKIVSAIGVTMAMGFGAYWIERAPGVRGYQGLMAIGIAFGFLYALMLLPPPGGAPVKSESSGPTPVRGFLAACRDRSFMTYLAGLCLARIGLGGYGFMPLYLTETLGLRTNHVFLYTTVVYLGTMSSTFLWGWSSDRFGSRPVMLAGLIGMAPAIVLWILIPAHASLTLPLVLAVTGLFYVVQEAFQIGSVRCLVVDIVPREKSLAYMPIYYTALSLAAGIASLWCGWLLVALRDVHWRVGPFQVVNYTWMFLLSFVFLALAVPVLRRVNTTGAMSTGEFVSMFVRGSPLAAFASMFRFRHASQEKARIHQTERMGGAKTMLNEEEMIEALSDPSFNVRYEAVVSTARMPPNRRLVEGLTQIVRDKEPELSMAAAWALGRMGDRRALPALREALKSEYALLRARIARSLGTLNDRDSVPALLTAFKSEPHDNLRLAYASALGMLKATEALEEVLAFLRRADKPAVRNELALALARMLGGEELFTRLWRAARADFRLACAEAAADFAKRLGRPRQGGESLERLARECALAWVGEDLETSVRLLGECARMAASAAMRPSMRALLAECGAQIQACGPARREYVVLALFALRAMAEEAVSANRAGNLIV